MVTNGVTRRQSELEALSKRGSPLPFAFPGKLSVVMVAPPGHSNHNLNQVINIFFRFIVLCLVDSSYSLIERPVYQFATIKPHKYFTRFIKPGLFNLNKYVSYKVVFQTNLLKIIINLFIHIVTTFIP